MMDIEQIVREAECKKLTGLCRTTRYLMEKEGKFPARVKITARAVGWKLSDIQAWIKETKCAAGELASLGGDAGSQSLETITIDKALLKQLIYLVLQLPDLSSQLAAIDVDPGATATGEMLVHLKPSNFLLRLGAALDACG